MKNSLWIMLYLLLLVAIVFFEYQKNDTASQKLVAHNYELKENQTLDALLLSYLDPLKDNTSLDKLWKIAPPKAPKIKAEKKDTNKTKLLTVTLKKKTICIEKKCFRLLGLFLDKNYFSSFYVKDAKEKVQTFSVGEILGSSIKINKINKNSIFFKDINSTREWSIKLFDINSSKYEPKEFE